jgi:hypothetical protein
MTRQLQRMYDMVAKQVRMLTAHTPYTFLPPDLQHFLKAGLEDSRQPT